MKGGLVSTSAAADAQGSTAGATGPPVVTGSPSLPTQSQYGQPQPQTQGQGVATTVDVGEMGPVDRLLAGTAWTREDVELVLQTISTLLLLYWAVTEVQ